MNCYITETNIILLFNYTLINKLIHEYIKAQLVGKKLYHRKVKLNKIEMQSAAYQYKSQQYPLRNLLTSNGMLSPKTLNLDAVTQRTIQKSI